MPQTQVVFYKETDGSIPMLDWFDGLPAKVVVKCRLKIERLQSLGYELRRPEADVLCNGIYAIRVGYQGLNYRMLYFFHGNIAAVLSHGLTKERAVPPVEIDRAVKRKARFLADPGAHQTEYT